MSDDDKKKSLEDEFEDMFETAVIDGAVEKKEEYTDDDLNADSVTITFEEPAEGEEDFGEFAEIEVYDGAEAEEIMEELAEGQEERGKEELADEVVIEQYPEVDEGEPGIVSPVELEEAEWRELIEDLKREAEVQEDDVIAARLHAEIGRIYERRLGEHVSAMNYYDKAMGKDSSCLFALQGGRRNHIRKGNWDDAKQVIEKEKTLARDGIITRRIEGIQADIKLWQEGEAGAMGEFETLRGSDPQNPYLALMSLFDALEKNDVKRAAKEYNGLSGLSQDKIFRSSLKSAAALLYEIMEMPDKAAALYGEVQNEGGVGFDRAADMAMWRIEVQKHQWAEAESRAHVSFDEKDSALIRGHRFLLAAQLLFVAGKVEEAQSLLRLLPQSTSSLFLQFFSALGSEGEEKLEILRKFEEKMYGPPPLKAAIQWILAESSAEKKEAINWYKRCVGSDKSLQLPEIELSALVTGRDDGEFFPMIEEVLEKCLKDEERKWIAAYVGLKLLENGREKDGEEILRRYIQESKDVDFIWLLNIFYLSKNKIDSWVEFMAGWSTVIDDADALLGVRILQSDINEFVIGRKEESESIYINLITDGAQTILPFHCLAFHPEHVQDSILFNKDTIMEYCCMEEGAELIPAVMIILNRGVISDPADRMEIYRKILEMKPGHLPAFCALRRELLSEGRYEDYFEILNEFLGVSQKLSSGLLGSDRMTLLWLSKQSLIFEEDLRKYLDEHREDPFVPVYLSAIDIFPKLSAESIEGIASQMPSASAQKWWFDAARRWAGVDTDRMLKCIGKLDEESWKRAGVSLIETDAWLRQEWSGITDELLDKLRGLDDSVDQAPVLSRMAYVDLMLKEETQMGFAEVQSMLQAETVPPLIELRMLLKHMILNEREEDIFPVLKALGLATKGSEESRVWAWLAYRLGREDPSCVEAIYTDILGGMEGLESDVPLLLLKEVLATGRKDIVELSRILESLALAIEGDREKGCLLWFLALMLADSDVENALNFAKEAVDKIPRIPGSAFLTEQIAVLKEDWSTAAMSARQAGGLFRESGHAVLELLRAAELYRDKIGETGWALQCFEQVLTIDPGNERAFEGLKASYEQTASWDRLASLVESRIALVEEEGEKIVLRRVLADTYEKAGRTMEAVDVANALADADPEDPEALLLLADLSIRGGQWESAAAALQQYLSLNVSDESKVENFMRLGDIYVDQLPDTERAIFCYEKVNEFGPIDLEVAEKLVDLYYKTMEWEKGLQTAQMLFENADEPEEEMKWLIMAGTFFEDGAKDFRRAEKAYETARGKAPTAHEPIVHMIRLYRKKNDTMALNFMLQRSIGDIKVFLRKNPDDMSLYHTIMHIVSEGGDVTSTRITGTLLSAFNELFPDETLLLQKSGGEITWQGGPWVAEQELDEHMLTPSMTPAFRTLVQRLEDTLMKSVPIDNSRYGISRGTRLHKKYAADEPMLDEVAGWFGVRKPQVHVVDVLPNMLGVLAGSPPLLVIGEPMYDQMSPAQKIFVFGWGCKLIRSRMLPLLSLPEEELPALWTALIQQFEPSYFLSGISVEATARFVYNIKKNFPKKLKEELLGLALECSSDPNISVPDLYAELVSYADMGALLACGSIKEAVKLHWMMHAGAQSPLTSGSQIQDVLSESAVMVRLSEFILSGPLAKCLAYLESGQ